MPGHLHRRRSEATGRGGTTGDGDRARFADLGHPALPEQRAAGAVAPADGEHADHVRPAPDHRQVAVQDLRAPVPPVADGLPRGRCPAQGRHRRGGNHLHLRHDLLRLPHPPGTGRSDHDRQAQLRAVSNRRLLHPSLQHRR
uniref:(northern house mosquito) hypothetical protein n=1 Tax=Culex pipiens TaxID=7175 RepID=A0A8D8CEQ8_CULPI